MSTPSSKHKIGNIDFLPVKQEYELVKKTGQMKYYKNISEGMKRIEIEKYFTMNQCKIILIIILKSCLEKRNTSRNG